MPEPFQFKTEVRVRLSETDVMGIVFHGCYFNYMEVGRMDYLRHLGLTHKDRPIKSFPNVVRRSTCEFESPARFDDLLEVYVRIPEIKNSSFKFEFLIINKEDQRVIARGEAVHVAIDESTWKPIRIPDSFRTVVRKFEGTSLSESTR